MPNLSDELEQHKTTDPADPISEQEPAHEDDDASGKTPEPVQGGNLSGDDRSGLLEDPAAQSGTSGGGRVAELKKMFESPPKPAEKPLAPSPGRSKVGALVQHFNALSGDSASESAATPPASVPSPDKYALLKKDVNSLTEEEKTERASLLLQKYVTDWKTEKEKQMRELTEDLGDNEKSKEETRISAPVPGKSRGEKFLTGVDKFKEWGDLGADIAGDASSFATDVAGTAYKSQGIDDHEPTSTAGNIAGIATGAWGTLSGGYGLFRGAQQARQKRKKGDSRGAALSRFDAASSLFGAASGATGMASGITGFTDGDAASNWLGHTSGILGLGGSITDLSKGAYQHRSYKNLANRKGNVDSKARLANQYMRSTERYKQMKTAYKKGDEGARSKENRMEMLKQRHDHKRSKDFMEAITSAQEHAKVKSQAGGRGALSGGLNILSGAMGVAGGFAKQFGGFGGMIAGTVLGGLSSLTKYATKYYDKKSGDKEEAAQKDANDTKGKAYIEEKAAKLMKKPDAQADHITEDEAKLIVASRLGVDNATDYAEVYKKLSERRADRILNKEEGYKEILEAMGLSEDADKATILEALGVS